jgi:excisionase family DNA binding protein
MNTQAEDGKTEEFETKNVLQVNRGEAAKLLNYSPATFDRLVKRGLIRANRATGRPRFSIKELHRFVEEAGGSQ